MREFLIPIHVREEEELYSAFDPSGLTLSSSLTDYLVDYDAHVYRRPDAD